MARARQISRCDAYPVSRDHFIGYWMRYAFFCGCHTIAVHGTVRPARKSIELVPVIPSTTDGHPPIEKAKRNVTRIVSFLILIAVLVFVGGLFVRVMAGFVLPMFLAAILVVIFRPLHEWLLEKCQGHYKVAAGLTTAAILIIVLVPLIGFLTRAAIEAYGMVRSQNQTQLQERLDRFRQNLNLEIEPDYQAIFSGIEASLQKLEKISAVGPAITEEDRREARELVSQMRKTITDFIGELVADGKLEKSVLESARTETDPDEDNANSVIGECVLRLLVAVDDLGRVFDSNAELQDGSFFSQRRFAEALSDVRARFREFKQEMLGGVFMSWLKEWANPTDDQLADLQSHVITFAQQWLGPLALGTTQTLIGFILGMVILVLSLYFFFADGPSMVRTVMRLSPVEDQYERQLLDEFDRVSRAVVLATLLSAFVQGILAGVGFYFAGLKSLFLLTVLTMMFALVPFVGAGAVWLPCSLWLMFVENQLLAGSLLALYGFFVVSMADNVVKPFVLHGHSSLHPLLALLSVLGGVRALGPIGVVVGPMVVVFLQALLNILNMEISKLDKSTLRQTGSTAKKLLEQEPGPTPPTPQQTDKAE